MRAAGHVRRWWIIDRAAGLLGFSSELSWTRCWKDEREDVREPAQRLRRRPVLFVSDIKDPFHSFDNMMANFRNRMTDMHKQFEGLSDNPNTHSFKSSSVMTYSKTGDEPAKVFQASSQTRQAPGGIKETKKAIRDSETGVEQIAVGHHIKDRAHIVKQLQNKKTGDREFNQEFLNMDETEAPSFNSEWDRELSRFKPFEHKLSIEDPKPKHHSTHYSTKIGLPDMPRRERCISKMVI
ncbi:myeloid leukemia factor 1 isoform X4 [Lithobates pipiens]